MNLTPESICHDFEKRWSAGERPDIAGFLSRVGSSERAALLRELIQIELWWRRRGSETPNVEEYQARFPDELQTVADAFASFLQWRPAAGERQCAEDLGATAISSPVSDPALQQTLLLG